MKQQQQRYPSIHPSIHLYSIIENCHGLARYAQICQSEGLVPIVEPEVLMVRQGGGKGEMCSF